MSIDLQQALTRADHYGLRQGMIVTVLAHVWGTYWPARDIARGAVVYAAPPSRVAHNTVRVLMRRTLPEPITGVLLGWTQRKVGYYEPATRNYYWGCEPEPASFYPDQHINVVVVSPSVGTDVRFRQPLVVLPEDVVSIVAAPVAAVSADAVFFEHEEWDREDGWYFSGYWYERPKEYCHAPAAETEQVRRVLTYYPSPYRQKTGIPCGITYRPTGVLESTGRREGWAAQRLKPDRQHRLLVLAPNDAGHRYTQTHLVLPDTVAQ